ncbi:uncharacterized protein STEHIDRAFT_156199 [Stereum hirsutum FP-91666 SS1]|uniref:uncharacterized protein n=1 Tax=Stereum hirsutum (strain FP-91666) TaxID=721885 RepID=UPI000440C9D3|nr:uncharacterized protein STEHIDRAFT_156199 [Stereum hirsutum FP-91666 SS1]EIM87212.1 hypothetical protein STEHIDRAFT_156199 [Stereum hirsutum FP-91666 SS1]
MKAANPQQLYICLSRMHHIVNPKKFRRLRREAEANDVFGLTGYPGVVIVEGSQRGVEGFLRGARGLRYLEFHHLSTEPAFPRVTSRPSLADSSGTDMTSTPRIMADLIPGARSGLHEVASMKEMVESMDTIGRKAWFREAMGMSGS